MDDIDEVCIAKAWFVYITHASCPIKLRVGTNCSCLHHCSLSGGTAKHLKHHCDNDPRVIFEFTVFDMCCKSVIAHFYLITPSCYKVLAEACYTSILDRKFEFLDDIVSSCNKFQKVQL